MIEETSIWYLGIAADRASYKLAKYVDTSMSGYATSTEAKVGLLRLGELMMGQFDSYGNNTDYWTLTPSGWLGVRYADYRGGAYFFPLDAAGVRPSLNLKSNVVITGGDGTKNSPFQLSVQ